MMQIAVTGEALLAAVREHLSENCRVFGIENLSVSWIMDQKPDIVLWDTDQIPVNTFTARLAILTAIVVVGDHTKTALAALPEDKRRLLTELDRKKGFSALETILGLARDRWEALLAHQQEGRHLVRHRRFERLLKELSGRFNNSDDQEIPEAINVALASLGQSENADHVFVSLMGDSYGSCRYEWTAEGVVPLREANQKLPVTDYSWLLGQIGYGKQVQISDLANMPEEAAAERSLLESQGIRAAVFLPLIKDGKVFGMCGLDFLHPVHPYPEYDLDMLQIWADLLAGAVFRYLNGRLPQSLEGDRLLGSVFQAMEDWILLITPDYRIITCNNESCRVDIENGGSPFCYQQVMGRKEPCEHCPMQKIAAGEDHVTSKMELPDGSIVQCGMAAVRNGEGKLEGIVSHLRDITEQEKTGQALRESEIRYRKVFENAPFGIYLFQDGRYLLTNQVGAEMMGLEHPDRIKDINFLDFFDQARRDFLLKRLHRIERGENNPPFETEIIRPDGVKLRVESQSQSVMLDGKPAGLIISRDLTAQREVEGRLSESMKTAEEIFHAVPSGLYIYELQDEDRLILVRGNHAASMLTGVETDKILGREFLEIWPGGQKLHQIMLQSVREKKIVTGLEGEHKDNTMTGFYRMSLFPISSNRIGVAFENVTERKKNEKALIESEWRYRTLAESFPDVIARIDTRKRILWMNRRDTKIFPQPDDLGSGKPLLEFTMNAELQRFMIECLDRVFREGKHFETEFEVLEHSKVHIYNWRILPEFFDKGKTRTVISIFRNITSHRQVEQNYAQLFLRMQDGFTLHEVETDVQGKVTDYRFVSVNPAFTEIMDLPESFFIGKRAAELYPEVAASLLPRIDRMMRSGEQIVFEEYYPQISKYLRVRLFRTRNRQFASLIQDISAQKRLEKRVELETRVLETLNSSSTLSETVRKTLMLIREYTGIEACGIRLKELDDYPYYETFGFPADFIKLENSLCSRDEDGNLECELSGKPILECMCGQVINSRTDPGQPFFTNQGSFWTNCTSDLLAGTTEEDRGAHTRNRCNGWGYESVALIPLRCGSETVGLLQLNDHNKNRFSEEEIHFFESLGNSIGVAIRQMRIQLSRDRIFNHSIDLLSMMTFDGRFLEVNPAWTKALGWEGDEILSMTIRDLVHPEDLPATREYIMRVPAGQPAKNFENRYLCKDGNYRWFSWNSWPMYEEGITLNVGRDITEQREKEHLHKHLERQLRQSQKMEAIGTLAGGIAHDFNNILAVILGYSDLVRLETDEQGEIQGYIREVINAGKRAKDLVQQILAFSRQSEQEYKPLQPALVVKEALKMLRASIPSTIEIRRSINSRSIILGDPTQIHQIVMNLCTNAYQAMKDTGGDLQVSLDDIEWEMVPDHVQVNLPKGRYVRLQVEDTGCGIPPENLERIFEPYFTTKKQEEGTGLGLAIIHGIITSSGGVIDVSSHPGEGTLFEIYLPAVKKSVDTEQENESMPEVRSKARILLVDDEEAIVRMNAKALTKQGYQVSSASNGEEAIQLFAESPDRFDLMVTDLTMPKMTGDRLSLEVHKIRSDIPVILYTGLAEGLSQERCLEVGVGLLMKKPLAIHELVRNIERLMSEGT